MLAYWGLLRTLLSGEALSLYKPWKGQKGLYGN
jgi:hypothetical protein